MPGIWIFKPAKNVILNEIGWITFEKDFILKILKIAITNVCCTSLSCTQFLISILFILKFEILFSLLLYFLCRIKLLFYTFCLLIQRLLLFIYFILLLLLSVLIHFSSFNFFFTTSLFEKHSLLLLMFGLFF